MSKQATISRRALLRSAAIPGTFGFGLAATASSAEKRIGDSEVLVAYFSRTGNTKVIAGQIRKARNAELFEIQPQAVYPEDYEEMVAQAQRERDAGYQPPLKEVVSDIGRYDAIFLGFPVWGMTAPPVIRSFLSAHDLSGKTLVPFITHGGYGLGTSLDVLAKHAPRAQRHDPFLMEADQERQTLTEVTQWLRGVPATQEL